MRQLKAEAFEVEAVEEGRESLLKLKANETRNLCVDIHMKRRNRKTEKQKHRERRKERSREKKRQKKTEILEWREKSIRFLH